MNTNPDPKFTLYTIYNFLVSDIECVNQRFNKHITCYPGHKMEVHVYETCDNYKYGLR